MYRSGLLILGFLVFMGTSVASAQIQWGRDLEDRNTFSIGLTLGQVFGLDGEVQETTRPIETIGAPTSGAPPEDYSWKELGFDDSFFVGGLTLEKMWRFVTLQSHALYGQHSVSGTADRNFYIGVGTVRHGGQSYDYMVIPENEQFSGDIDAYAFDARMLITPLSFGSSRSIQFTPWVHLGVFGFIADYEINAGPSQKVIQYENPPRDYVVGGRGTGRTGLLVPELGFGGELSLAFNDRVRLSLQGHAAFLKYKGSNRDFGVSSRNEKAVEVDYRNIGARVLLEMAMNNRVDLILGVEFQYWTGDADVRAKDKPEEEMRALREKFDKEVHFEMSSVLGILGLRF